MAGRRAARRGTARQGNDAFNRTGFRSRPTKGVARLGTARHGEARQGKGMRRYLVDQSTLSILARQGVAGHGPAMQGKVNASISGGSIDLLDTGAARLCDAGHDYARHGKASKRRL